METPAPIQTDAETEARSSSIVSRMLNILAAPGEVYSEIKDLPPAVGNWLCPVLLSAVVGVIAVLVMFSQPAVLQEIKERQEASLQKKVDAGKMSAADMERTQAMMERLGPTMMKLGGSVGAVAGTFGWVFLLGLILKGVSRFGLGQPVGYMKAVEVAGLASMISVLGGIVHMLLVIIKGSMFVSLGPAFFLERVDSENKAHLLLQSVNLMTFWYMAVLAVGLAAVSGQKSALKAGVWLLGLWVVLRVGVVFSGLGGSGL